MSTVIGMKRFTNRQMYATASNILVIAVKLVQHENYSYMNISTMSFNFIFVKLFLVSGDLQVVKTPLIYLYYHKLKYASNSLIGLIFFRPQHSSIFFRKRTFS